MILIFLVICLIARCLAVRRVNEILPPPVKDIEMKQINKQKKEYSKLA
jgi:hypothetical protein